MDLGGVGPADVVAVAALAPDLCSALIAVGSAELRLGGIAVQVVDGLTPAAGAHTLVVIASLGPVTPCLTSRVVRGPRGVRAFPPAALSELQRIWPAHQMASLDPGADLLRLGA